jgi:hypothetical protein
LWFINCALFNSFIIYKKLNPTTKLRYKEFLLRVAKAWASDKMEVGETESDRLSATGALNSYPM